LICGVKNCVRGLRVCAFITTEKNGPLLMNSPPFKCQSYCNIILGTLDPEHFCSFKYCTFTATNAVTGNFTLSRSSRGGWVSFLSHCSSYSFFITLCFPSHLLRPIYSKTRFKSQHDNALHSVNLHI